MSNFEDSRQEHTEEQDSGIEMINLEPSEPTDTLDKIKRDLSARVEKRLPAKPFLFKRGKVPLPALVNIYDAHSVKLLTQVHPDSTILPALNKLVKPFSDQQASPIIYYQTLLWSPDEHYLALLFYALPFFNFTAVGSFRIDGLLLLGKDGKQQVFLHQEKLEVASLYSYVRWDIQRGTATVVRYRANTTDSYQFTPTSNSLSYHWGAGNMLVSDTQTGNASPFVFSLHPMGNPDGDSSFSTRQPGYILYVTQSGHSSLYIPGVYVWQSLFPAWSPDGRFLVNELVAGGLLEAPGQNLLSPQALQDLAVDQLPIFQVHDKALVQVLRTLSSLPGTNGSPGINVSWRPDGRVLATYYPGHVDVYDCVTGQKLASLAPTLSPARLNVFDQDVLRWSLDGTHLLLSSGNWGPIQLWGPGQLPK